MLSFNPKPNDWYGVALPLPWPCHEGHVGHCCLLPLGRLPRPSPLLVLHRATQSHKKKSQDKCLLWGRSFGDASDVGLGHCHKLVCSLLSPICGVCNANFVFWAWMWTWLVLSCAFWVGEKSKMIWGSVWQAGRPASRPTARPRPDQSWPMHTLSAATLSWWPHPQ